MSDDSGVPAPGAERPRPQFGEYATPEEQRARIQRPEVTEALEAGVAPQPERESPAAAKAPVALAAPATGGARVDRIVTFGLLFYGLFSVVTTIVQLLNFPEYAERGAQMLGVTATFTNLSPDTSGAPLPPWCTASGGCSRRSSPGGVCAAAGSRSGSPSSASSRRRSSPVSA